MRFCFFLQRHDMPKPLACLLVPLFVRVLPTCFSSPASGTSRARTNFDISCPLITMMLKFMFYGVQLYLQSCRAPCSCKKNGSLQESAGLGRRPCRHCGRASYATSDYLNDTTALAVSWAASSGRELRSLLSDTWLGTLPFSPAALCHFTWPRKVFVQLRLPALCLPMSW